MATIFPYSVKEGDRVQIDYSRKGNMNTIDHKRATVERISDDGKMMILDVHRAGTWKVDRDAIDVLQESDGYTDIHGGRHHGSLRSYGRV